MANLGACGGVRTPMPEGDLRATALTYDIPLYIESRYRAELTLFVVHDGIVTRLQNLTPSTRRALVIPARFVGTTGAVALYVEGVGSRSGNATMRFQTQRVRVLPGQSLRFTIETDLPRSFLQINSDAPPAGPDTTKDGGGATRSR